MNYCRKHLPATKTNLTSLIFQIQQRKISPQRNINRLLKVEPQSTKGQNPLEISTEQIVVFCINSNIFMRLVNDRIKNKNYISMASVIDNRFDVFPIFGLNRNPICNHLFIHYFFILSLQYVVLHLEHISLLLLTCENQNVIVDIGYEEKYVAQPQTSQLQIVPVLSDAVGPHQTFLDFFVDSS